MWEDAYACGDSRVVLKTAEESDIVVDQLSPDPLAASDIGISWRVQETREKCAGVRHCLSTVCTIEYVISKKSSE